MQPLRIALAQLAPRLGALDANLERHHALLRDARAGGAGLVVFPELGLTGYLLQDLAAEVAMRLDDPRLADLAAETAGGPSAVVSFVEESGDHRLFIAAALAGGRRDPARPPEGLPADVRPVRRAPLLRRRRRRPGDAVAARRRRRASRSARTSGTSRRRSCWRSTARSSCSTSSSSPGRDLAASERGRPRHRDLVAHAHADVRAADRPRSSSS